MGSFLNDHLSIIIPTLNEGEHIARTIEAAGAGTWGDITVVDAGSSDTTREQAAESGARVITAQPGRGRQMNQGAKQSTGRYLLFLHGDTILPDGFARLIQQTLDRPEVAAGAFSLRINGTKTGFRLIETGANLRSHFFHLPYGDQAIFTTRDNFSSVGGFPETPIMEDYLFIKELGKKGKVVTLPQHVLTSPRRWDNMGLIRTTCINQLILIGHAFGIAPNRLARLYRRAKGVGRMTNA